MRKRASRNGISVNAIAGTHVVMLGMDATDAARKGLLGFAIHRTDKTGDEQYWLKGFRTFEEVDPHPAPGALVSTQEAPVQAFNWGDYTAKPNNEYIYKVVPVYGKPKNLKYGDPVEVDVTTENEDNQTHAIFFNRGVAGSQAYAKRFHNKSPEEAGPEAFKWLSRGLEEAILEFIGLAKNKNFALRACVYEFSHEGVLNAFKKASDACKDVKIVYDCRKEQPQKTSDNAIAKAKIKTLMIPRKADPNYISHNKFIILLEKGKPVQVLTGSTNFTNGGIYGQSNVVHIVRDPKVAAQYLDYWTQLSTDTPAKTLRTWNNEKTPTPTDRLPKGVSPVFSPRSNLSALEWYSREIDTAKTMSGFTAAFGVNKLFAAVMADNTKNIRYALLEKKGGTFGTFENNRNNFISIGAFLGKKAVGDAKLHRWLSEELSGLNSFVKYLHTKYLLVDPLSDDPVVISGSANFSNASTKNNDENMLVIRGNTMVADIYFGEFMRIWDHFYFRDVANRYASIRKGKKVDDLDKSPYLKPDDSWAAPYYDAENNFLKTQRRLLFK